MGDKLYLLSKKIIVLFCCNTLQLFFINIHSTINRECSADLESANYNFF